MLLTAVPTGIVAHAADREVLVIAALVGVASAVGTLGSLVYDVLYEIPKARFVSLIPFGMGFGAVVAFAGWGSVESVAIGLLCGIPAGWAWGPREPARTGT